MFPDFRIIILPKEDLSSYPLAMKLLEHILWGIFLQDLEKTIWLSFSFLYTHCFCEKNEDINEPCIPFPKSRGLSLSTFYFSVCQITEME